MSSAVRHLNLSASSPHFAGLFLIALVAFWPSYLSRLSDHNFYTHLHAAAASIWIMFLIVQPLLIRKRKTELHRTIGRLSYLFAPFMILSIILLANSRIQGLEGEDFTRKTFVLYLQMSLVTLFTLSYVLAIYHRHNVSLHPRFMICTALTLVDPIVIRLMVWVHSPPSWNYWWVTFGLTDLIFLCLIFLERRSPQGRWVFPSMLFIFILAQIPALFELTDAQVWQSFSRWYSGLPLT